MPGMDDVLEDAARGLPYTRGDAHEAAALLASTGEPFAAAPGGGRVALRVSDPDMHAQLVARGARPWREDEAAWLLVPQEMTREPRQLREWVVRAHALATHGPGEDAERQVVDESFRE